MDLNKLEDITSYSEQVHLDFPTEKDIDKLTDVQLKKIWKHAPFGYFKTTSNLANYFQDSLEKRGLFTTQYSKEAEKVYFKNLKEYSKNNEVKSGDMLALNLWEIENGVT